LKTNGPSDYEPPINSNNNRSHGSNRPNNRPNFNQSGNNIPGNNRPNSGIPGFKGPVINNPNNSSSRQSNIPNNRKSSNNVINSNNQDYYNQNPNSLNRSNMSQNSTNNNKFSRTLPNRTRSGYYNNPNNMNQNKGFFTKKRILMLLKYIAIAGIIGVIAVAGVIYHTISSYNKSPRKLTDSQLTLANLTTSIYDKDGQLMQKLTNDANKDFIPLSQIQPELQNAFIALEDERFYSHHGVDYQGFMRGMITTLIGSPSGGSTLTMQLVRNITDYRDSGYQRKILEMYRALELEKRLTKKKILEKYLNIIYMGTDPDPKDTVSVYGVKSAAIRFFDKDISEGKKLTPAECAIIAGITQMPNYYMPCNKVNQDHILKKAREIVLKKMYEQKYLDAAQYEKARTEEVVFKKGNLKLGSSTEQSYFVDAVISQAKSDIAKSTGTKEGLASTNIYTQGYKIYTTFNKSIQDKMDSVFLNEQKYFGSTIGKKFTSTDPAEKALNNKIYNPQAGMVIIDPKTGYVQALYGGRGKKSGAMKSNYATGVGMGTGGRGPGSSFKPVSVYAPALDAGIINPGSVVDDAPLYELDSAGKERYPKNYTPNTYNGMITVRQAVTISDNIVVAKLFKKLDKTSVIDTLDKMNLYDKESDKNGDKFKVASYNVPLGESVSETPLKMAAAYSSFVNGGLYTEPTVYTKILDCQNNVIIDKTKGQTKSKKTLVFSEQTAYLMTSMLKSVVEAKDGTAYGRTIHNKNNQIIETAGKTGTTSSDKDRWFVGYTPYYVGAVWYGDDASLPLLSDTKRDHLNIWSDVMSAVHQDLGAATFTKPGGIDEVDLCKYSGLLPSGLCSKDPQGNAIKKDLVNKKFEPKKMCDVHVESQYCQEAFNKYHKLYLAGPGCPRDKLFTKVLRQRNDVLKTVHPQDLQLILDISYTAITDKCPIHTGTYTGENTPQPSITPTETPGYNTELPTFTFPTWSHTPKPTNSPTTTPSITETPTTTATKKNSIFD